MARDFKKMQIYHLAYNFVLNIYRFSKDFPDSEKNNITSQLRRASVSIPLNIAEGSAKAGDREFANYLNIAWASGKEVEVLLNLCYDLNYLTSKDFTKLSNQLDEVNAKLFLFLRNIADRVNHKRYKFFKKFEEAY